MMIKSESVKIIPAATPVYSLGFCALHTPILSSVTIRGLAGLSAHSVSLSVYGLSKSGFFSEKCVFSGGELFFRETEGDLHFDLQNADFRLKKDFFRNLKAPVTGKICVEALIDGVRFSGDAPITLLPARTYPVGAASAYFAVCLSPFHSEISRIIENVPPRDLEALYASLKREAIIYSVKDCDFLRKNTPFDDIRTLYTGRARMASPLEMAQLFCCAALRVGFSPIVAAFRGGKAPHLFCGVAEEGVFDRAVGLSHARLLSALGTRRAAVFDVSCLFTGHSVELSDACHKAEEELRDLNPAFIVDIGRVLAGGADFFGLYPEDAPHEKAFLETLRKAPDTKKNTLSSLAESLTHTDKTPLLSYSFEEHGGIFVHFSDFSLLPSLAAKEVEYALAGTADLADLQKIAPYPDGISALFPAPSRTSELNRAEKDELERHIAAYRAALSELERKNTLGVPQSLALQLSEAEALLGTTEDGEKELYLACGFLRYSEKLAPAALYPVHLAVSGNRLFLRFTAKVPYVNRLLCETVKRLGAGAFFERYGLPGNDFSDIMTCFETLCEKSGYTFIKEAAIGAFPYRNSVLAFDIVDKSDKILADKTASFLLSDEEKTPPALSDERVRANKETVRKLSETLLSPFDGDALLAAALCRDEDLLLSSGDAALFSDAVLAAAQNNLRLGFSTLICAEETSSLSALEASFDDCGLSECVLPLHDGCETKEVLRTKLAALSSAALSEAENGESGEVEGKNESSLSDAEAEEYVLLRDRLFAYHDAKAKRFDFAFSFYDAARAYTAAGEKLSEEEREIRIEPETIFYPDMGKASVEALFEAQHELCRAARALFPDRPYKEHPFFSVGTTENELALPTVAHLLEKCRLAAEEFLPAARTVSESMGFVPSDISSLPSLYALLSLSVLLLKRCDAGITGELLAGDVYAVSQKLCALSELAADILREKEGLCEFDEGIFSLDAKDLFDKWASGHDLSRSDITKTVNAYRTVEPAFSDSAKKGTAEVLHSLYRLSELCARFDEESNEVAPYFAGYWNGTGTDFQKLFALSDFAKNADVLLKKIFGTDTEARKKAAKALPDAASRLASDEELSGAVVSAAGLFDRMFSDESSFLRLASMLGVDLYALCFEDGILSDNGLYALLCDWQSAADILPRVCEYNRCAARCRKLGISVFVDYLETHAATAGVEAIFLRSQLHLILKQIALCGKKLLSYPDYGRDAARLCGLHEKRLRDNRRAVRELYLRRVGAYLRENPEKAAAFSDDLSRESVCAEDILLRHGDLLRTLFPIVTAQPSRTGFLSGFETVAVLDAGRLTPERILSALPHAKHKLFLSDPQTELSASAAALLRRGGITVFSPAPSDGKRAEALSHFLSPVSGFDRESGKNVPEAQTVGLEVLKALEQDPEQKIALLAANRGQLGALRGVLRILCEKSPAADRAVKERRIDILPAEVKLYRHYDLVLLGAAYGAEGGDIDVPAEKPASLLSALCGADTKRAVLVSTFAPHRYPDLLGSRAALFAASLSTAASEGIDALYDPYRPTRNVEASAVEFCRLLTKHKIPCALLRDGRGVVFGEGQNRKNCRFDSEGLIPDLSKNPALLHLDSAALYLDPQKLLFEVEALLGENKNEKDKEGTV